MKLNRDDLLQQRQALLLQMQSIDRLRRGSLSQQFFQARPPAPTARQGPYYVLQGFFHGKKFSERIAPEQAPQVEQDVENYRRFQTLAEEYVTLSDQITRLQDQPQESKKKLQPEEVAHEQFQETTAFLRLVGQSLAAREWPTWRRSNWAGVRPS